MRQRKKTRARGATIGHARHGRALAGGVFAIPCVVAVVMMASSFSAEPSRAETAAPSKAGECLARPTGLSPKGSHWFYRLDRKNGRRCWYLGPESNRVRRSETAAERRETAAERSAAKDAAKGATKSAAPTPRERPALRPVEAAPPDVVAQAPAVSTTNFSGQWPSVPTAVVPFARGPAAATVGGSTVGNGGGTTATADTPTVDTTTDMTLAGDGRPATIAATSANAAAVASDLAQPSEPLPPTLGQLMIFFTASAAFVAIAFRATLDLSAIWLTRRRRRRMPPAPVFVRPQASARPAFDDEPDPSQDPDWLHKRLAAMRRDPTDRANPPLAADDPPLTYGMPRRRAVA